MRTKRQAQKEPCHPKISPRAAFSLPGHAPHSTAVESARGEPDYEKHFVSKEIGLDAFAFAMGILLELLMAVSQEPQGLKYRLP
jgi:hypothetical protein